MEQSNKDKENTYAKNLFLEKKNQKEQINVQNELIKNLTEQMNAYKLRFEQGLYKILEITLF
jgi:hypothetical protein